MHTKLYAFFKKLDIFNIFLDFLYKKSRDYCNSQLQQSLDSPKFNMFFN